MLTRLFTLILILSPLFLFSQWTYNTAYFADAGNPNGINTESDAAAVGTWTVISPGAQSTNVWSTVDNIPFAFDFFGVPVTQIKASHNGVVTFDPATTVIPGINENLPSMNLPDMSIGGFWDEFTASPPTGTNDEIRSNTFGTAPNRQYWVTWFSFEMGNPTVSFSYFSVVLEESTNKIYVVDKYGTTAGALTATIGVQFDNTTAVQYGNDQISGNGNGSANPDNDYYEFTPMPLFNDDAGVFAFLSPVTPLTTGVQNVDIQLKNYGINQLTNTTIYWEIDSAPQTPLNWTGVLSPNATTTATLGTHNFLDGFTTLKAWTSMPNGTTDSFMPNDTTEITLCTSIMGTFSVGGGAADFPDLTSAVDALDCGISGPVVFNVMPGVYNEALAIEEVLGASATNTITFDGGSSTTTTITSNSDVGPPAVILLDGADFVTFQNFTIENKGTSDAWGVFLTNAADNNSILACDFLMDPGTSLIDVASIVASGNIADDFTEGNNCNFLTVEDCYFTGGERGIVLEALGALPTDFAQGNRILNNEFVAVEDYGVYVDNQDGLEIVGNTMNNFISIQADGIYSFDLMNFKINTNNIHAPDYGIYISDGNFDDVPLVRGEINNNMVLSDTDYGMYLLDLQATNIFHNTVQGEPGIRVGTNMDALELFNNIFASRNDFTLEMDSDVGVSKMDFNIYFPLPGNSLFSKFGTTTYTDLATWQAGVVSFNANSRQGDPLFVTPTDLHVFGGLAYDAGNNNVVVPFDIDGDARPLPPSTTVDIGADEYDIVADDASLVTFVNPMQGDCAGTVSIEARLFNLGANPITSLPITVITSGAATSNFTFNYTGNLTLNQTQDVVLGTVNVPPAGGLLDITVIADLTGDNNPTNDTITTSIALTSSEPATGNGESICSGSSATLIPNYEFGVTYGWFDAPGGNFLGIDTLTVSGLTTNTTYYISQVVYAVESITTTFAAGNGCGGGNMFDVTNIGTFDYTIDSIDVNLNSSGTQPVNVWYIPNGTFNGNETNMAAWTLLTNETVMNGVADVANTVTLGTPLTIPAGATYALYVEYDANYTNGSSTYTNGDLSIQMGTGLCSAFGGTNTGREFNGTLWYSALDLTGATVCNATVSPVVVTVNQGPNVDLGADQVDCPGNPFLLDAGVPTATSYLWSTGEVTQMISVTMPGDYWVDVFVPQCSTPIRDSISVSNYPGIGAVGTTTQASCAGNDGAVNLLIVGGVAPYSVLWDNGATTEDISNLPPGTYQATVTDVNNCSFVSATYTISLPPGAIASTTNITDPTCAGNTDGAIDLTLSGGTAPYAYTWSNGETTEDINNLPAGMYNVVVTDGGGCALTVMATVTDPTGVSQGSTIIDDATCSDSNDGAINPTFNGGTMPYTFVWSNGVTTQNNGGLAPGLYLLTIIDANGCSSAIPAMTVSGPTAISAQASITDVLCFGEANGIATLAPTGGTSPYSYSWDNGEVGSTVTSLTAGTHTVTISDAAGCLLIESVTIGSPGLLSTTGTVTDESVMGANDGSITTTTAGGTGPYSYLWSNGATTGGLGNLAPGNYDNTVTDANGCTTTGSYTVNGGSVSVENISSLIHLELYPNPTDMDAILVLELDQSKDVTISLVNTIGQVMQTFNESGLTTKQFKFEMAGYASGIYFVKIQIGDQYITKKLSLVKE